MTRTTEQWEQLLEGTTPGPWEIETIPEMRYAHGETWEELGYHTVCGEHGPLFATDEQTVEEAEQYDDNEANIRLAAHAPEAVSEVIRLRREIEAVRDDYQRSAEVDSLLSQFSTVPLIPVFNDLADTLTHILEGETNE